MNENIKAGADIHAGDGGYSIGTQEKYEEFVKARNYSMGKARIQELAERADPEHWHSRWYSGINPRVMDPEIKKFVDLIVRECLSNMEDCDGDLDFAIWKTKKDFGVEE